VEVVPFIRVYRTRADYGTWQGNREIHAMIVEEEKRGFYKGIGEFHVHGRARDTPVRKDIVDFSVAKGLVLHAHSDDEAIEILFATTRRRGHLGATGFGHAAGARGEMLRKYPAAPGASSPTARSRSAGSCRRWKHLHAASHALRGGLGHVGQRALGVLPVDHGRYRRWLGDLPTDVAERIAWANGAELFGLRHSYSLSGGQLHTRLRSP
jgi:hypothetical protein